jgi:hypothetical protein
MAQSSAKIHNHNDMIIDLEKKIELLTKGSHLITILFSKTFLQKIWAMQKSFITFWNQNIISRMLNLAL